MPVPFADLQLQYQNIKGEKTELCPKCNKRPLYGSQAKERSRWMPPPAAKPAANVAKPA